MKTITYLLGAGASANALPLIKKNSTYNIPGLPEELEQFVETNTASILTQNDWSNQEISVLKELTEKCKEFGTPDLFAKYLLETGNDTHYRILKTLLSNYFIHTQNTRQKFDYRALSFLTAITQNKKIPPNIKILSWNYDSQIEMAAVRLKPVSPSGYPQVQDFTCWPNHVDGYQHHDAPFLLHLNGVAGYHYSVDNLSERISDDFKFNTALDKELLLSFAWENENTNANRMFHERRLDFAKKIASETHILVIIGYSFPFFNRVIDAEIFKAMYKSLNKIYYQDPTYDGSNLKGLFDIPPKTLANIVHIQQTDNYHIPYEL